MKKAIFFLSVFLVSLSCAFTNGEKEQQTSGDQNTSTGGEKLNVGLCLTQLGDNSIGDQLYNGVLAAQKKWGFDLDYTECGTSDMAAVMQDYTESKEYDLIVLLSYHAMDAAIAMHDKYPDQKYLIYDVGVSGKPGIMSESFAKNQLGFVAGAYAALMDQQGQITINGQTKKFTPSHNFGEMIGVELTSTVGAMTGFAAGVHYIDPDAKVQYVSVGSWTDQTRAKELALTVYNNGANILFHNAGGAFLGALEAAKTVDKFAIGYDANQNALDATHIIGSSHKQNTDVIVRFFDLFCSGGWKGGTNIVNGFDNDGAKLTYQENLEVPEDVRKVINEVIAKIKSGEIVPPNTWDEEKNFLLTYNN